MENNTRNSYWYYPEKDMKFENRKEVKDYFGHSYFNILCREKKVYLVVEEIDWDKKVSQNS